MTIVIQGALNQELDILQEYFKPDKVKTIAGFDFCIASYKGSDIVLSKTGVGLINACVSTAAAIDEFKPTLVINQGCAGGHTAEMQQGDLIIGEKTVYINNFYTNAKGRGEGSSSLDWYPCKRSYAVDSTPKYVQAAEGVSYGGKKIVGILGSGDIFSKEVDRINYLHSLFGELSEDMESVAALKTCELYGVDRLALRVISNNELISSDFTYDVCKPLQSFVISLIDGII